MIEINVSASGFVLSEEILFAYFFPRHPEFYGCSCSNSDHRRGFDSTLVRRKTLLVFFRFDGAWDSGFDVTRSQGFRFRV